MGVGPETGMISFPRLSQLRPKKHRTFSGERPKAFLVGRDLSISSLCSVVLSTQTADGEGNRRLLSLRPKCGGRVMPFFWRRKEFLKQGMLQLPLNRETRMVLK